MNSANEFEKKDLSKEFLLTEEENILRFFGDILNLCSCL